ncbi:hypothetical protein MKD52_00860 [Helicobacter sp. CaF467b]|uniref:hypothetical protein n=1 Tax=Helicobacter sp. CaF467b TaxID=2919923 RepID=UPI001F599F08|nr:hypothetical protein [Helicobacter sp. CaF467b]MCI2235391.1 hypothetical protein [Helicobacter sp. CaF467b]
MSYFRFVVYWFGCFILLSVLSLGLIYMYDPMQIFHKPYFRETTFLMDMRRQALGIIKHYDFDSYILGTSMLENTSAKEANEKLGGNWVNISLSGSVFNERAVILNYLFAHKQPQSILYSLDGSAVVNARLKNVDSFGYLYDDDTFNDIKVYLNKKTIICALTFSEKEECIGKTFDGDSIVSWIIYEKIRKGFGGIENLIKYDKHSQDQYTIDRLKYYQSNVLNSQNIVDISKQKEYIQKYLLSFMEKYPQTHFYIIIPAYSRLFYRKEMEKGYFKNNSIYFYTWKEILTWLIKETSHYSNVTFYGFDTLDYADNIANYKDSTHYNIDMNSLQLDSIQNKKHILTPDNIESYFDIFEQKIQDYDLTPLINIIKDSKILEK